MAEHLGLNCGEQSRLIVANGFDGVDKVKLVARVLRHCRGPAFVSSYKFALDSMNGSVYILAPSDEDAASLAGCSFEVDGQNLCFY